MQIHFVKQFPWGEPSHFIEKIWAGFASSDFLWEKRDGQWATEIFKEKWPYADSVEDPNHWWYPFMSCKPKLHTIREDVRDRWHHGRIIHFMQWTGKPYYSKCYHFAPLIPCMGFQTIEIEYLGGKPIVVIDHRHFYNPMVGVDRGILQLAQNDGFETIDQFFRWFKADFKGKIIHWTDLRY